MSSSEKSGGPLRRLLARVLGPRTGGAVGPHPPLDPSVSSIHNDWSTLPPLRTPLHRRVEETSGVTQFSLGVRHQHRSPAGLARLGHQVAADAPKGIATGIARAVTPVASAPAPPAMPLREAARPRRSSRRGTWPATPPLSDISERVTSAIVAPSATGTAPPVTTTPTSQDTDGHDSPSAAAATSSGPGAPPPVAVGRVLRAAAPARRVTPTPSVGHSPALPLRTVSAVRQAVLPQATPQADRGSREELGDAPDPAGGVREVSAAPALPPGGSPSAVDVTGLDQPTTTPVRPTLGSAPIARQVSGHDGSVAANGEGPGAPVQRQTDTGAGSAQVSLPVTGRRGEPASRPASGVGAPLSSLPTSARPFTAPRDRGRPSVTGTGRQDAISQGLQQWLNPPAVSRADGASPPQTQELPLPAPRATTGGPVLAGPPVVARRLGPTTARSSKASEPVAPLVGALRPLTSRAEPPPGVPESARNGTAMEEASRIAPVPLRWRDGAPTPTDGRPPRQGAVASPPRRANGAASPGRPSAQVLRSPDAPGRAPHESEGPTSDGSRVRTTRAAPATDPTSTNAGSSLAVVHTGDRTHGWSDQGGRPQPLARTQAPPVVHRAAGQQERPLPLPRLPAVLRRAAESAPASPAPLPGQPSPPADGGRSAPALPPLPADPVVQREEVATIGSATADSDDAAGEAVPADDVNALFRKLYPRVRDELRWELRVQRERAGMLSDPL